MTIQEEIRLARLKNLIKQNTNIDILRSLIKEYDALVAKSEKNKTISHNTSDERPNPMDYDNTPEGDAQYFDDYWQGNIDAMLYHDDIGDR